MENSIIAIKIVFTIVQSSLLLYRKLIQAKLTVCRS